MQAAESRYTARALVAASFWSMSYNRSRRSRILPKTQPSTRTIKGGEFVKDIRSGMTDLQLSVKYGLTVRDFDRLLGYLVDAGLITEGELQERQQLSDSQILRAFVESHEDIKIVE